MTDEKDKLIGVTPITYEGCPERIWNLKKVLDKFEIENIVAPDMSLMLKKNGHIKAIISEGKEWFNVQIFDKLDGRSKHENAKAYFGFTLDSRTAVYFISENETEHSRAMNIFYGREAKDSDLHITVGD